MTGKISPYNPVPLARQIEDNLIRQGRGAELEHPNAGPYWTGTEDDIRYVCQFCADWFETAVEVEQHIGAEHPPGAERT